MVEDIRRLVERLDFDATFTSTAFLLLLLPLALAGYWAVPSRRWKRGWLVMMSLAFYAMWDVRFVGLLLACALWDFVIALRIGAAQGAVRKRWLLASIALNLGTLAFFKYAMFGAEAARSILALLGIPVVLPYFHIVLPVGLSFYTFQTLSYTIDVYRSEVEPTRDVVKYLAFVSLFPQLVAGPIVRYQEMDAQLDALPRRLPRAALALGVGLFVVGMFKKLAIADALAPHVEAALVASDPTLAGAWIGAAGFAVQLYFDFSGYSDMALGLGALMAFSLPENFRSPYQALDISDHWRRWHMTLSRFLRDYVYVPLGGNRAGPRRTLINMFLVMVLAGLWHGAAWTMVAWGALHGVLLILHRSTKDQWARLPAAVRRSATLLIVVLGLVLFRAADFASAGRTYANLVDWDHLAHGRELLVLPIVLGLLLALATLPRRLEWRSLHTTRDGLLVGALVAILCVLLLAQPESPYLYYQF